MENISINKLMKLIHLLSIENKLEVLSRLSNSLKSDLNENKDRKSELLNELYGSWKNFPENIEIEIINSRNNSDREISFD